MSRSSSARRHEPGWRAARAALRDLDPYDAASLALFGVIALLVVATFQSYAVTWDEQFHTDYGDRILAYFASGFRDTSALGYPGGQQPTYGGAFDLLGALVRRGSPFDAFDTMHLVGGLVGLVGIVGAYALGRLLMGPGGGFWSALLLTLTPAYYGAMFNNPKDPPFAVGYVWALYALCAVARKLPRPSATRWAVLALCLGAAMSVRVAGMITLAYLGVLLVGYAAARAWAAGHLRQGLHTLARLALPAAGAAAAAWALMVACWPWAHAAPLGRPLAALAVVSDYNLFVEQRPFGDERIWSFDPPWDYLPRYFAMQLPDLVLVLALVGVAAAAWMLWRRRGDLPRLPRLAGFVIVAAAILAPPTFAMIRGSALYDGLRHFLFLAPPIAVAAGCTATAMGRELGRRRRLYAWALYAALAVAAGHQAQVMRRLHPHEYVYFNALSGGLPAAHGRYDADYYGSAYREAFDCLRSHLWQTERDAYLHRIYRLSGCLSADAADAYREPHFEWLGFGGRGEADFFLAYGRNDCRRFAEGREPLCRIERFGVPLAEVYDLRR